MTMSDPLADMFTRLRNAAQARHATVRMPASNVKRNVARVLQDEGFISGFSEEREGPRAFLNMQLTYD